MTKSLEARLLSELNAAHGRPDTLGGGPHSTGIQVMELRERRILEEIHESS
jgi:hypothetical protein